MADLLLCHASANPDRLAALLEGEQQSCKWLFLGQDYLQLLRWRTAIGSLAEQVDIGDRLNQVADELRHPFLDLITELGRRNNSIAWWSARLSERNTMVSPLFLYCCYFNLAYETVIETAERYCVISESWEVLESLAQIAGEHQLPVRWASRPVPGSRQIFSGIRLTKRVLHFLWRSLLQILPDSAAPSDGRRPHIFLRTWVDEDCLGAEGKFKDRYLPGLCAWLESRGYAVVTLPVLFNIKRSYRSAWAFLSQSNQRFLNPFKYCRFSDYVFALRESARQLSMRCEPAVLKGMDVSRLFKAERLRGSFDMNCLDSLLFYRLPRRLAARGVSFEIFIDAYENMIPEKLLNLGFRRYLPETRLVGYQHGSLYPLLLCNFLTAGEVDFAPMPDRVVCNGEFFRDVLIDEGLPAEKAVVGPAMRYRHLWSKVDTVANANRRSVLVPLPLVLDSAAELLKKMVAAVEPLPDVSVALKVHPMTSPAKVIAAAGLDRLPSQFYFAEGGMGELLAEARLVVALSSSTVHETVAAGVPVIVVGRDTSLDLNPLGWYADLGQVFRTAEEIRDEICRMLSLSDQELKSYRDRGMEVLRTCFAPVTDEAMSVFVDGLLPAR
jgi:hypothetical protein